MEGTGACSALAMLLAAVSGCAAKTDAETESQQTETAAPAAQEETDASGVPGVEDEALAAKLIEQAKHPLYQLCDSDPTCTNGIVAPYQKSRAAIEQGHPHRRRHLYERQNQARFSGLHDGKRLVC